MRALLSLGIYLLLVTSALAQAETTAVLPLKALPKTLPIGSLVQVDDTFVADLLAEGLFDMGEGFQLDPILAESVKWDADGRRLKIKIRKSTFSDGTPVTASAVVSSIERCIKSAEVALAISLQDIEGYQDFVSGKSKTLSGIKRVSESEIEILTTKKSPLLVDNLAFSSCSIVKPNPATGSLDLFGGAIGSGPYVLEQLSPSKIILKKRSSYHHPLNGPDTVIFQATDHYGDYEALKSWATVILTENDPGETPDFNRFEHSELGSYQLVLNNSRAPFQNLNVRKALAVGLDFNLLAKELSWSEERLQAGLFPFGLRGFKKRDPSRDLEEARKLLRAQGYTDKNPLTFSVLMSRSKITEKEATVWPKLFSGLPVKVNVELLLQSELVARRNAGNYEALRVIKSPGSVDGHRLLSSYISNSQFNTPRAKLPACDALIYEALKISSLDERYKVYEKADNCLISNVILIPLSSLQPGFVLLKKPWSLKRKNRYYRKPYDTSEWSADAK